MRVACGMAMLFLLVGNGFECTGIYAAEEQPPGRLTISDLETVEVGDTTASVEWTTNAPATGQVIYGRATDYSSVSKKTTELTQDHLLVLTRLRPLTTYHFRAISVDAKDRVALSRDQTFTTTGIVISEVKVKITSDAEAVILWTTDRPATGMVRYGLTASYDQETKPEGTGGTTHSCAVGNLEPFKEYHFQLVCVGEEGMRATSKDATFVSGLAKFEDGTQAGVFSFPGQMQAPSGVAWADVDGDGDLDVFVSSESTQPRFFQYDGVAFVDASQAVGLSSAPRARSAAWADYSGDGLPDLFLSSPALFTNTGTGARNDTQLLPALGGYNTEGAGWLDYDNDGLPDILLSNGAAAGYGFALFRNCGEGPTWLRDVSEQAKVKSIGVANGDYSAICDYDADGHADFIYNAQNGLLVHNNGDGTFSAVQGSGISYPTSDRGGPKIGVTFGDYDNDGDFDLFVPRTGKNTLYRNDGESKFSDVTAECGELGAHGDSSNSAAWGDVNNDGHLDVYVGNRNGPNRLYVNLGDGKFADRTLEYGVRLGRTNSTTGIAFADFDNDGDLDLLANSAPQPKLFVNKWQANEEHTFVKVVPKGRGVIGALVRLRSADGKLLGIREINGGDNFGSQGPRSAIFGVAPGDYEVEVQFTNGVKKAAEAKATVKGIRLVVENE